MDYLVIKLNAMKNWIILLSLLIPISSYATIQVSTEIWVSEKHEAKVKFKFYKNKIKAKHLTKRGWSTFKEVTPGVYDNRRGSKLIIESPNVIVFSTRNKRKNIVFRPIPIRQRSISCPPASTHTNQFLGGTWNIKQLNKKLYISEQSNGFEARLSGQSTWTRYIQKDSGFYVDSNGNSYTVKSKNELFWESKNGRQVFQVYR